MPKQLNSKEDNIDSSIRLEKYAHNVAENYFMHFALRQNDILNKIADKAPQKYLDNLIKIMISYLYKPPVVEIDNSKKILNVAFSEKLFELKKKNILIEKAEADGNIISRVYTETGEEIINYNDS